MIPCLRVQIVPQPPRLANQLLPVFPSVGNQFHTPGHSVYCPAMAHRGTLAIGLTGGIGTGKSRVAELLRTLGAAVECSDEIVREIQASGGAALAQIAATFGETYVLPSGELDRARLGELVFRDPDARRKLGNLIHPLVYRELARRLEAHRQREVQVVVLDIPLLLEGRQAGRGSSALLPFDLILLVYADEETQLERIMARDGLSHEDALARIRSQLAIEEKRALADVVIDNSGKWEATVQRVQECYEQWVSADGPSAAPA